MNGWIYIAIVLGLLLALGAVVDWRRRGSTGGSKGAETPSEARRRADGSNAFNQPGGFSGPS